MKLQEYIEEVKLELTGGILDLEIPDETIGKIIKKAFRELLRYGDMTNFVTVPFASCIDLKDFKCSSISNVYRASAIGDSDTSYSGRVDPMYAQRWQIYSMGSGYPMYNLNNYLLKYMSYTTLQQIENTTSTPLSFIEDIEGQRLYINETNDIPARITIEYVPLYEDVDDLKSIYWIDILQRLSVAHTKVILGRIRTKYKETNSLWEMDGETMLQEGNNELSALREELGVNSTLFFPIN